jgi:hypothetical protein
MKYLSRFNTHCFKNSPIIRLNPSLLIINSVTSYFRDIQTINNKSKTGKLTHMSIAQLNHKFVPSSVDFTDKIKMLEFNSVKYDKMILDISDLDFEYRHIKDIYDEHEHIDLIFDECMKIKKEFNIDQKVDGYLIGYNKYMFFYK